MTSCLQRLSAVLLAVTVTSIAAETSGIFVPPQAQDGLDFGAISAPVFPTQVVSLSTVIQGMRTYT